MSTTGVGQGIRKPIRPCLLITPNPYPSPKGGEKTVVSSRGKLLLSVYGKPSISPANSQIYVGNFFSRAPVTKIEGRKLGRKGGEKNEND
jgi:hypothetical protein